MNIKTRLWIIVLTILLLPPITIGFQLYYQRLTGNDSSEALVLSVRILAERLDDAVERRDFSAFARFPRSAELLVRLDDGTVLYKTPGGREATPNGDDGRDYHLFRFISKTGNGTVVLAVPGYLIDQRFRGFFPFPFTLAVLLIIIVGLLLFMLRKLDVSIRKLERATEKIASGDLDFPSKEFITREFDSLGRALDRMRIQLKEDRERRDRFIMGISHDLKTPLAVIQGYLDAMVEGLADTEEKREAYQNILRNHANLLEARIEHLIELAKTASTEWRQNLNAQDLGSFLSDTLQPLSEYASFHGFTLTVSNGLPAPCLIDFDRDMLRRVFENLISNAVSYGDSKFPILVKVQEDPPGGIIEIRVDN